MTPRKMTPAERTLASEIRAVEGGHQARLSGDGRAFLVRGDDHPDKEYRVTVHLVAGIPVFSCDHPVKLGYETQPERSTIPCRHGSTAARRLEREGLLRWEAGHWLPTAKALAAAEEKYKGPDDPFEGLPK